MITHQEPFYAATAQTVEIEPSQSKPFPQGIQDAPILLPPSRFLQSPRSSEPRRQSVRTGTDETLSPASGSPSQFQPPNTISPPAPTSPRKPAPGKDVDELSKTPPLRHWSGHEYLHQHTADSYSYRFDTYSSDSGPSNYTSADISGGVHAQVWPIYHSVSQEFDQKLFSRWNDDLDLLLIFVSHLLNGSP